MAIPRLCVSAHVVVSTTGPDRESDQDDDGLGRAASVAIDVPADADRVVVVSAHDVALYDYDVDSDQSNARIVVGERICEGTLLRGLLVHSAGDYSQLLQSIIGWSPATFVRVMNTDARQMGLTRTHYVDLTRHLTRRPVDRRESGDVGGQSHERPNRSSTRSSH